MNIIIVGTGYVGLVQAAALASFGHRVLCIDIDEDKINNLNSGILPFFEPGLLELVEEGKRKGHLIFSVSWLEDFLPEVVFMCVNTPASEDGSANLEYHNNALITAGQNMSSYTVIVNKSTVPVGTGGVSRELISKHTDCDFSIVSNPEFLAQGSAVKDCLFPSRVILGFEENDEKAKSVLHSLYEFYSCPIIDTDVKTAELIKYSANSFLATQISYINSISRICEALGCDVNDISQGMMLDERIGHKAFLRAGLGYGGSCFSKDIRALLHTSEKFNYDFGILQAVEKVNKEQRTVILEKIISSLGGDVSGKNIACWGLSFKPKTDDIRDAPSIDVINFLLEKGARVRAYDPCSISMQRAEKVIPQADFVDCRYSVCKGADILVVFTEWDEFKKPDFSRLKINLKQPIIVDGRNLYKRDLMKEKGFRYLSIGRPDIDF